MSSNRYPSDNIILKACNFHSICTVTLYKYGLMLITAGMLKKEQ